MRGGGYLKSLITLIRKRLILEHCCVIALFQFSVNFTKLYIWRFHASYVTTLKDSFVPFHLNLTTCTNSLPLRGLSQRPFTKIGTSSQGDTKTPLDFYCTDVHFSQITRILSYHKDRKNSTEKWQKSVCRFDLSCRSSVLCRFFFFFDFRHFSVLIIAKFNRKV